MLQPKVTIAICTYNRAEKLGRLLNCIIDNLSIPASSNVDFLVVNNNSHDNTTELAERFIGQLPLRVFVEKKQGLSNARNRAIEETNADWLIFLDDDILLDTNLLKAYLKLIESNKIDFIGGRILLNWLKPKPNWLVSEDMPLISGVLGKFDLGKETSSFEINEAPRGANFAVSRRVIKKIGDFDTRFGVTGEKPGRGEETEYFRRATEAGFNGVYCGEAMCLHDALVERLTTQYMFSHGYEKGRAEYVLGSTIRHSFKNELALMMKAFFQLLKLRKDRYLQTIINIGIVRGFRSEANKNNKTEREK